MSECGCAYEVMPGGVYPERRYFHEPDCELAQPVVEVAQTIAAGGAFSDQDAVRVARAFLEQA